MQVWKEVFNYPEDPITTVVPLTNEYCQPRPDVDLKKMKMSSKILDNLPDGAVPKHLRQDKGLPVLDDPPEQEG